MLPHLPIRLLALLSSGAFLVAPAFGQGDKRNPEPGDGAEKAKGEAKGDEREEEEGGGLQATRFMPLGRPNLQVKIPQFEDGELQCVMNAQEMTRIGEDDIDIKAMDMEFLEDGEAVTRIELLDARYNLTDKLIKTDKRAVVQRADFTLVGSSLEFDTAGQRGKMQGKVRMVIHDTAGLTGADEEDDAKPDDDPGAGEDAGLTVVEAARMIARVAEFQKRQRPGDAPDPNPQTAP